MALVNEAEHIALKPRKIAWRQDRRDALTAEIANPAAKAARRRCGQKGPSESEGVYPILILFVTYHEASDR